MSAGAFLPPALQQAWEDMGVIVLQGYGATETGTGSCTTLQDHGLGTVGRPPAGIEMRLAEDGEILFRGPTLFKGYWNAPELTADAFTPDGWYRTGDIGHLDPAGRLILSGRKKDIIVLPNGFNVYPEDLENALRIAGLRDSVVLETRPGRIEAVLLSPAGGPVRQPHEALGFDPASPPVELRAQIDAAVRAANATLGPNQRIVGWRLWPDSDFPRTHTLKIKRAQVRAWAAVDAPLPVGGGLTADKAARSSLSSDLNAPVPIWPSASSSQVRPRVRRVPATTVKKTTVEPTTRRTKCDPAATGPVRFRPEVCWRRRWPYRSPRRGRSPGPQS